jgi:hypothetical protein
VRFVLGAYNRHYPVVIDPVLEYGTFVGGSRDELGQYVAVDMAGNAYVTGPTQSLDLVRGAPGAQSTFGGGTDAFITKINATGTAIVYSTYLGGSGDDLPGSVAVDAAGNAWITGRTSSRNFPIRGAAPQSAPGGGDDAFAAKIDAGGATLLASTYIGGSGNEAGHSVALDSGGNPVIAGATASPNFPFITGLSFQDRIAGGSDGFLVKYNSAGNSVLFATYFGGDRDDVPYAIAVHASGDVFLTGETRSSRLPGGSDQFFQFVNRAAFRSAFAARFDASGRFTKYVTFLGGATDQAAFTVAVDAAGNAVLGGATNSQDFPVTRTSAFQSSNRGGAVGFITVLNDRGPGLAASTYVGGSGTDIVYSVALDSAGRIYAAGYTDSGNFLAPVRPPPQAAPQLFATQFDEMLSRPRFASYFAAISSVLAFRVRNCIWRVPGWRPSGSLPRSARP